MDNRKLKMENGKWKLKMKNGKLRIGTTALAVAKKYD
jgi:hypothetical protein